MRDETRIDEQEMEERHEAMDYAQHEKTWGIVTNLVKWAIIQLAFLVVGLFCIIQAGAPVAGVILILIGLASPGIWMLFAPRRVAG
ncbi:MAG TPA: aa3-type cytochrome c oxidase subunit IV [Devosia sp.]|nr:aa3-type cytochrome c oxidase subunit IV [Devosia sp.]